jgi:2-methylcitrate dehydratase PrpD
MNAEFLADIRAIAHGEMPDDVRAIAQCCIFDWTGVALAGVHEPMMPMLLAELLTTPAAASSLIGLRARTAPHSAALYNGAAGDALDFSDCNRTMNGHATATVFPAALAIADATDASGEVLLRAFITGVEAACRIGRIVGEGVLATAFHPTAVAGPFGAAAAGAALLGLDDAATAHALAIAGTQAAGLADAVATMSKPLHAGTAAAAGTLAARLAARGFTGPANILAPQRGFLRAHTAVVEMDALAACRGEFLIRQTLMKAYAACALTHGTIDNMRTLQRTHALAPESIDRVRIDIAASSAAICDIVAPQSGLEAKFSVRTVAALTLLGYDTAERDTFAGGLERADDIVALRERISVVADAGTDVAVSRARITLTDGRTLDAFTDERIIDRDLNRRRSRTRAKFRNLTAPYLTPQQAADIEGRIFDIGSRQRLDLQP